MIRLGIVRTGQKFQQNLLDMIRTQCDLRCVEFLPGTLRMFQLALHIRAGKFRMLCAPHLAESHPHTVGKDHPWS